MCTDLIRDVNNVTNCGIIIYRSTEIGADDNADNNADNNAWAHPLTFL